MQRFLNALTAAACGAFLFSAQPAAGQETVDPQTVQARIDSLSTAQDLDESAKESLRTQYSKVLETLARTRQNLEERDRFDSTVANVEKELETAGKQLAELNSSGQGEEPADWVNLSPEALDARITALNSELDRLKNEWRGVEERRTALLGRSGAIATERIDAATALRKLTEETPTESGPAGTRTGEAGRLLAMATKGELESRLRRLESDEASLVARKRISDAQSELLSAQVAGCEQRLASATAARAEGLKKQAHAAVKRAEKSRDDNNPIVSGLAREVEKFSAELALAVEQQAEVEAIYREISEERKSLEQTSAMIRAQAQSADVGGYFAEALLEERVRLPGLLPAEARWKELRRGLGDVQLRAYRIAEAKRAERVSAETAETIAKAGRDARDLEAKRRDLVNRLDEEYMRLTRRMAALGFEEQALRDAVNDYRVWLDRKLVSVRSLPPISSASADSAFEALKTVTGRLQWDQVNDTIYRAALSRPFSIGTALALLALLIAFRRRIWNLIGQTGKRVKRVREDNFSETLRGIFLTVLVSLPLPLAMVLAGKIFQSGTDESRWIDAIGYGLVRVSPIVTLGIFLFHLMAPRGVGEAHFRWPSWLSGLVRREFIWYFPIQMFGLIVVATVYRTWEMDRGIQEIGRAAYMVSDSALTLFLFRLFRPKTGVFSRSLAEQPDGWASRLRAVWFACILALPVTMLTLAGTGYFIAALKIRERMAASGQFALLALLGHALLYRWVSIRQRKLALQKAIEERREQQEETAKEKAGEDETDAPEVEEPEIDISLMALQTVRLLRFALISVLIGGLWSIWSGMVPALSGVGPGWTIGGVELMNLAYAILVGLITFVAARNLPGLLEITILQNLPIRQGTRYAISTLGQYATISIGAVVGLNVMGLDASKLGWILAALSVGLGFGLQEIVANFVCGIILLFERPIRVGDVITIGEVTGTVSRINIRATTVTDWDRKEYIVPNKEFIAGNLMNWTLTSPVNRLSLNVGIAYGSDVAKAEAIVLQIASEIPEVLDDPAPFVVLDSFGDSSLNLIVRVFLVGLDHRVRVIHQINTEIHRRFREQGIEIPFPQRDLNVRTLPESLRFSTPAPDTIPRN